METGLVRAAKEQGKREQQDKRERGQVVRRGEKERGKDQFKSELYLFVPECSLLPWLRCCL